jgi:RNA polymerase sigma-70 factor (ECF subfamily)
LRKLFEQHGPVVYRRALRILGNPADAEEATQEVFMRVIRCAESFEERSQVTTWLYRITTNYCLNLVRDRKRQRELLEENHGSEGEMQREAAPDQLLMLRRVLAQADEDQARAAIYVYLDGMSHQEAAEILGVSRRTIGHWLERFAAEVHALEVESIPPPASAPSESKDQTADKRRVRAGGSP